MTANIITHRAYLKQILAYLISGFLCVQIYAQDYVINLQHWDMSNGLSDRLIHCIFQDSRGFIWVGSRNGLDRFDGYKFINYKVDPAGLTFNNVYQIIEDSDGIFWLRWEDNRISLFDPVKEKLVPVPANLARLKIVCLKKLSNEDIFIQTEDRQHSYIFHSQTKRLKEIPLPNNGKRVFVIRADSNSFWIGYEGQKGLLEFDRDGRLLKSLPTTQPFDIFWFLPLYDGICEWIPDPANPSIVKSYLWQKNGTRKDITSLLPPFSKDLLGPIYNFPPFGITSPVITETDSIVFFEGKIYHPHKGILRDFAAEGLKDFENLRWHMTDRNGAIWVGSAFGLYQITISRNKFKQYFYDPSFNFDNNNSYRNILVMGKNVYAVNEEKGILVEALNNTAAFPAFKDLTGMSPHEGLSYCLTEKDSQHIYSFSTSRFYEIQLPAKVIRSYALELLSNDTERKALGCRTMVKIPPAKWLLGLDKGLSWLDPDAGTARPFNGYNQFTNLAKEIVFHIIPDDGQYWVCSHKGLYVFDPVKGITARYSAIDSGSNYLPVSWVYYVHKDKEGVYWLATPNGLLRWEKEHHYYRLFRKADGLTHDKIYAVYEDDHNRLWLSSDYGIMSFDKKTRFIKSYVEEDGITHNEFNSTSHCKDAAGNIYFGSLNGVTSFNPDDFPLTGTGKTNPLVITSLTQFDRDTRQETNNTAAALAINEIMLRPSQNLSLEFALLNYQDPGETIYYWRIDEMGSAWKSQKERVLRFESLPYGRKTLRIKAIAANGAPGNELVIRLNIITPLFQRGWFILSVILLVLALGIVFYWWRVRQLEKTNTRLDNTVKERTHDLQVSLQQKDVLMKEIHHRVKNNLQVIGTLMELQLSGIKDENARKALIESQSRVRSIALIHQQLYQREHLTTIGLSDFAKDLFHQVNSVYNNHTRRIELNNHIPGVLLDIDTAIPIGLILNELMTNSYKHAFNGKDGFIELSLQKKPEYYILHYKDSGAGLPPDYDIKNSKSLGLIVLHSLTKQLGGSFRYHDGAFIIYFKDEAGRKMTE